jgi:hypothetical protein
MQGSDVVLVTFLTVKHDLRVMYQECLQVSTATVPLLSCPCCTTWSPGGSRIYWRLAGDVCCGLFAKLCHRNGLPLTGLMAVPDDIKVEILMRLTTAMT